MKKIICLICAMIMLSGQVFANENYIPDDVVDTEYESAYEILTGLSIFDYNDDSSFRPLTPITRGELSIALGNIMNSIPADGNVYFDDVPREHKAFAAVSKLTGYGIISGFGNGLFYPDDNIKAVDAVKLLLSLMGYSPRAEYLGGYPNGYIQTAYEIGLLKGVMLENSGVLMRGEAAKMLLNSLEIPVMSAGISGANELTIDKNKDFLYTAMGIKKIKGAVNANYLYAVDGGLIAPRNSLRIDNTIYRIYNSNWEDMVGYNVTCYFDEDEFGENKVRYLYKNASRINEITVLAKNAESFIYPNFYYRNETTSVRRKLVVSKSLCMIYNGLQKTTILATDFKPANGELNFIDIDDDNIYDIVKIKTYENALVSNVTKDAIYISCPANDKIEIKDYRSFAVYDMKGNEIGISDLKENDVISIYKSIDKSIVNIVYSREKIEGTVSSSYEEDGIKKLVIDDILYDLSYDYDKSFSDLLSVGTNGTFCLDANGDVYTMVGEKTTTKKYGYVIRVREISREDSYCLRLVEETGKIVDRPLAKKVKVDGVGSIAPNTALGLISKVVPSPVVYKTNRAGEITMVDTTSVGLKNDDDCLKAVSTGASGMYRTRTMCFNFALPIDENTKIFIIPNDPNSTDVNEYGFADYKILENEVTYSNMDCYSLSNKLTADIVVMRENSSSNTVIGIITGTKTALNIHNEITTCYTVQTGSSELSYSAADEQVSQEIQKITSGSGSDTTVLADSTKKLRVGAGDLVKLYVNSAGEIGKISIIYDFDADTVYSSNNIADANVTSFDRYMLGDISDIYKDIVAVAKTPTSNEYYNLKGKKIYIYTDAKHSGNRISEGRTGDLKKGDKILIVSRGGIPQYAFAY